MYSIQTVALQDLLPMEFSRQEYWSAVPLPSPGYLPDPGMEPISLTSLALTGFFTTSVTGKAFREYNQYFTITENGINSLETVNHL